MPEVIKFRAKPKTITGKYKNCTYTITYDPAEQLWHWRYTRVLNLPMHGSCPSLAEAQQSVRESIEGSEV